MLPNPLHGRLHAQPPTAALQLAIIVGSNREGRLGDAIGRWFATHAGQHDEFALDYIDLAATHLPPQLTKRRTPALDEFAARIAAADAFVIVTPEYNRGYPALLKHALDLVYTEWQAKPVAFVSYGGISGGLRAVEQLRQVFAELHTVTIRDSVSLPNIHTHADADGMHHEPAGSAAACKTLLDRLAWWAAALRTARVRQAYS